MKQIPKSPEMVKLLTAAVGDGVDVETLAVYEATAANLLPLRKRHPIYKGAVFNEDLLRAMAAQLRAESIPLHIMHDNDVLPIGRVFHAEVVLNGVQPELRALFFLPPESGKFASLVDSGTVDQVSVGMMPKKILCSECGFDYLGSDAGWENIMDGVCNEGHVLGERGVHAKLVGLDRWFELSLVNTGGAQKARIHSRGTSKLAPLAASGIDPEIVYLTLSSKEMTEMPGNAGAIELGELVTRLVAAEKFKADTEPQITKLTADLAESQAEVASLKAAADADKTDLTDKVTDLTAKLGKAKVFLVEQSNKILPLAGMAALGEDSDIEALTAAILQAQEKLKSVIPAGGASKSAISDATTPGSASAGAFSIRKK